MIALGGSPRTDPLTYLAYAKVNLTLEVLGRRDDGYHEVATVLQSVNLSDKLTFLPDAQLLLECSIPTLSNTNNLAWKATLALKEATGYPGGARIRIEKGIPEAMGLGGGSADAAATLVALNQLWGLDMAATDLEALGRSLGADVPFFVKGGTALGTGRGDRLERLNPIPRQWLLLVCPPITVQDKTRRIYGMLDADAYTHGQVTKALVDAIGQTQITHQMLYNVFESVAFGVFPTLSATMEAMTEAGARHVSLSGSGPALFTLISHEEEGRCIQAKLTKLGHQSHLVKTTIASPHLTLDT